MKNNILALGIVLLFTTSLFAQTNKASAVSLSANTTKYIIGIANEDNKLFNEVLADLQESGNIRVNAYCERNKVIALTVSNNDFKSYDFIRDFLLGEYPTIALFRKEETILNLDCKDQISKQ